ncbi:hypothetical protein DEJ48_36655 [Streptomyces venezuelae]|uniref:Uncharacterized protein n=1 Tax=Streptomyces venezuelae TaxID=54571 RepID=A0A5P2CA48_STRVZ|nr:hypothetical protein [Streptomyces venezuelae]QES38221.1 hypothetical protein DEJ48_36655 [Streptomyces venezuelae]
MIDIADSLEEALAGVLAEHERGLLARAVVVAEVLDEDGERTLSILTTPGVMEWDALGLCRYGVISVEGPAAAYFAGGDL